VGHCVGQKWEKVESLGKKVILLFFAGIYPIKIGSHVCLSTWARFVGQTGIPPPREEEVVGVFGVSIKDFY
jgi:hypothetical protein